MRAGKVETRATAEKLEERVTEGSKRLRKGKWRVLGRTNKEGESGKEESWSLWTERRRSGQGEKEVTFLKIWWILIEGQIFLACY